MVSDRIIWIWLSLAVGAGSKVYNKLFASFDTLSEIYSSPKERFLEIDGVSETMAEKLSDKDTSRAENILSVCIKRRWGVLTYGDKGYPKRLKNLIDPPVVLYYRGRFVDLNDQVCIAVVGTRRMTEYGERQAYKLSYAMASGGAVIVSGMALGCDSMAANGALDAGAPTVAVLGCGIDRIYPPEHKILAEHIMRGGMIITEYAPGEPPTGSHFPVRNRIISGLSQGTLVVEAPLGSGALITARTALIQGRDIFAVPGELGNENSAGGNELIKSGARVVTTASDILSVYEFTYPH
ncbi:MAG: DNA-processing protein DprA, partial [Firmicutes bacterium]|nr:DNA-processing protein DprA [Bacillota bacterium]